MKEVIYKPDEHKYFVEGKEMPSVNQILRDEGAIPEFPASAGYKRELGTYGHQLIQLYFENNLDESTICEPLKPYYQGFLKFLSKTELGDPLEVEKSLYSEKWGYCGTIDCIADGNLIDWKFSPNIYPHYELTMGAYSLLFEEYLGFKPKEVWLVSILPDDYKLNIIEPDTQTFLAFLIVHKWKKKRGGR